MSNEDENSLKKIKNLENRSFSSLSNQFPTYTSKILPKTFRINQKKPNEVNTNKFPIDFLLRFYCLMSQKHISISIPKRDIKNFLIPNNRIIFLCKFLCHTKPQLSITLSITLSVLLCGPTRAFIELNFSCGFLWHKLASNWVSLLVMDFRVDKHDESLIDFVRKSFLFVFGWKFGRISNFNVF